MILSARQHQKRKLKINRRKSTTPLQLSLTNKYIDENKTL